MCCIYIYIYIYIHIMHVFESVCVYIYICIGSVAFFLCLYAELYSTVILGAKRLLISLLPPWAVVEMILRRFAMTCETRVFAR